MSIESFKSRSESNPEKERNKAIEAIKKKTREILAWGFICLSAFSVPSFGGLRTKFKAPESPKDTKKVSALLGKLDKENTGQLFIEKIKNIQKEFGAKTVLGLKTLTDNCERKVSRQPIIKGFDNVFPGADEILKNIWNENLYPSGWINEIIAEVRFTEEAESGMADYGKQLKNIKPAASYGGESISKKQPIVFYKASTKNIVSDNEKNKAEIIDAIDHTFAHEIGHANDWEAEELTFKQRINFLADVLRQYKETNFNVWYVQQIRHDENAQLEDYQRINEYWAECCRFYFTFPEYFKKAFPKEFALVDKYAKAEDPVYDAEKTNDYKTLIINKMIQEHGKN